MSSTHSKQRKLPVAISFFPSLQQAVNAGKVIAPASALLPQVSHPVVQTSATSTPDNAADTTNSKLGGRREKTGVFRDKPSTTLRNKNVDGYVAPAPRHTASPVVKGRVSSPVSGEYDDADCELGTSTYDFIAKTSNNKDKMVESGATVGPQRNSNAIDSRK